jgi:rare lipoprotein A
MTVGSTIAGPIQPAGRRRLRGLGLAALFGLALGGCAEGELAIHASKNIGPRSDSGNRGIYKIGEPYQIQGVWYYPAEDYGYDETGIASWYGPDFHGKYTANGELYDMNDLTAAHRTLPMPSFVRVTNLDNGRSIVLRVNDRGPYARGRILDLSRRAAQLLGVEAVGTAKVRVQIMADESHQLADAMRQPNRGGVVAVANRVQTQPGEPPPVAAPRANVASETLAPPPGMPVTAPPNAPPPIVGGVAVAALPDPTGEVRQTKPQRTSIFVQAGAFADPDNAARLSAQLRGFGPAAVTPVMVGGKQLFRVRLGPLSSVEVGDRTLDQVVNAGHPEARLIVD